MNEPKPNVARDALRRPLGRRALRLELAERAARDVEPAGPTAELVDYSQRRIVKPRRRGGR